MKETARTFRQLMSEKLANSALEKVFIPFHKWIGWKTCTRPLMVQSFLGAEKAADLSVRLSIIRAYADDESDRAWREFSPFDYAGDITSLGELIFEIKNHPDFSDDDFPLDVTEYDILIENLSELVATDVLRRCYA